MKVMHLLEAAMKVMHLLEEAMKLMHLLEAAMKQLLPTLTPKNPSNVPAVLP